MVIDPELPADGMDGEPAGSVSEETTAAGRQRQQLVRVAARGDVGQQGDRSAGDGGGGLADGAEQVEDPVGVVARREGVDRELHQGWARDAVPVWAARFDSAGGDEVVETIGDERREERGELFAGGTRAWFFKVDELVGFEAEDFGQIGSIAPRPDEVANARERIAAVLEPTDELEPPDVRRSVDSNPAAAHRRREKTDRLVLPDRPRRKPRSGSQLIDRQRFDRGVRVSDHAWTIPKMTVTVNAVMVSDPVSRLSTQLLRVLRRVSGDPSLAYAGEPAALTGGFWAELVTFRLIDPPTGWDGPLVARVMPDAATAAKESVFQARVADQGYSTPVVLAAGGPDDGVNGKAFMVMPLADGEPLLAGLDGLRALARLPSLARRLPSTLATVLAELHRLDPAPVERDLDTNGIARPGLDAMLESLCTTSTAIGRTDLAAAATWLQMHRPPDEPVVVCHGDLHPFNVLVDDRGTTTVLDWSAALLAPGTYDLGFTSLVVASPPLVVPPLLRPVVAAAGRALARRFVRSYERTTGDRVGAASLAWHQCVVCVRALLEVAGWAAAGTIDDRAGHPWVISGDAFASRLRDLTGVEVRSR